jgi:two-component sensor histidine kinase
MIASELYNNALEHGVLGLSSSLKSSVSGFEQYYKLRAERLAELESDFIDLDFTFVRAEPNEVHLTITDSGEGFNIEKFLPSNSQQPTDAAKAHGRGISLLHQLCSSLKFENGGRTVKAIYQFH